VIAGGAIRSVMELAGVKNVVSKMLGSNNKVNNVKAVFAAFQKMKSKEDLAKMRK
jgi:small subunit ribosomal protein S5